MIKKKLQYWIETLMKGCYAKDFCNEYHLRKFLRNQRLIDFDFIPDEKEDDIYNTYKNTTVAGRGSILTYLINNDMKELIGKIEEF